MPQPRGTPSGGVNHRTAPYPCELSNSLWPGQRWLQLGTTVARSGASVGVACASQSHAGSSPPAEASEVLLPVWGLYTFRASRQLVEAFQCAGVDKSFSWAAGHKKSGVGERRGSTPAEVWTVHYFGGESNRRVQLMLGTARPVGARLGRGNPGGAPVPWRLVFV